MQYCDKSLRWLELCSASCGSTCVEDESGLDAENTVQGQDVSGGKRGAEDEPEDAGGGPPDADSGLISCNRFIGLVT
jgi:hypothetical protein